MCLVSVRAWGGEGTNRYKEETILMPHKSKNPVSKSGSMSAKRKKDPTIPPEGAERATLMSTRPKNKSMQPFEDLAAVTGAGSTFTKNG
jgi:hypothetical protein